MDARRLAIVGTGPGCREVTLADLEGRDVCAVNQAANHVPRLDILAFMDPVEMIAPTIQRRDFHTVWCALGAVKYAQDAFHWATIQEGAALQAKMRLGEWVERQPQYEIPGLQQIQAKQFIRYGYVMPSMAMALITAGVRGYRDVLVFGAPMTGTGSPARAFSPNPDSLGSPVAGYLPEAIPAYADRWGRERRLFGWAVRYLRNFHRCRVRRVPAQPVAS